MASELLERTMYSGLVHVVHNPMAKGSQPRYKVTTGGVTTKPQGVTTILGQTLSKDLMKWAVDSACSYLRTKLPTVTEADLAVAADEYNRLRDAGGSTGTEAHFLVETFLKTGLKEGQLSGASPEARNAYQAFLQWFIETNPTVINVEEVIYSHKFQYAGTYDCMFNIDEKVYLCDLKTTNASRKAPKGVYAEHFIQLGAYAAAHEEQRLYEEASGGSKLLQIEGLMVISAKKDGKLDIVTAQDMGLTVAECGKMFQRVVNIHNFLDYLTKELGGK